MFFSPFYCHANLFFQSRSLPALSTPYSAPSPLESSSDSENEQVITAYDQKGFTTVYTVAAGASAQTKSFDSQGFLITAAPTQAAPTSGVAANAVQKGAEESKVPPVPTADSSGYRLLVESGFVFLAALLSAIPIIL
jgi:hypothetical protein